MRSRPEVVLGRARRQDPDSGREPGAPAHDCLWDGGCAKANMDAAAAIGIFECFQRFLSLYCTQLQWHGLGILRAIMTTACAVPPRILIADDQRDLLDALHLLLKGAGMAMDAVTSPEAVVDVNAYLRGVTISCAGD